MQYHSSYTEFWRHLYNQLEDLYGYMPFEEFIQDPWGNLVKLGKDSELPGALLGYINQRVYVSSDELPQLERFLDLYVIVAVAENVMAGADQAGGERNAYLLQ